MSGAKGKGYNYWRDHHEWHRRDFDPTGQEQGGILKRNGRWIVGRHYGWGLGILVRPPTMVWYCGWWVIQYIWDDKEAR